MNLLFPTVCKFCRNSILLLIGFVNLFCSHSNKQSTVSEEEDDILHGTIAFPFLEDQAPIGRDAKEDKFVIRSAVGNTEYEIQIPGAAQDYDIQVPLAEFNESDVMLSGGKSARNPHLTDKELSSAMPRLDQRDPRTVALTDKAFGVGEQGGPGQGPSYTLALSRIRKLYTENQFELALIDVNNLLQFHPNSVDLYKMKGTLYFKLQNLPLARIAWDKALRISPRDRKLAKAIESLDRKQEKAVLPATMPLENHQSGMFAPSTFSRPSQNSAPILNQNAAPSNQIKGSNSINGANAKVSNAFATPKSGNFEAQNNNAKSLNSNTTPQNNSVNANSGSASTENLENEADEFDQFDEQATEESVE
ncbi:MAG: hypothetical protein KBD78_13885 [Oligoflexales bacterium]|nr:hypothetical protein [Oligoflexales bacterium]